MVTNLPTTRPNILNLHKTTIRSHHHQPPRPHNRNRIQRLTPRPPTLQPRPLPPTTTKQRPRHKLRQLHRQPRRNKRTPTNNPPKPARSNPLHQRNPLLHMHQTHRRIRNHHPHPPPRPNIQTMAHLPTNTTQLKHHNNRIPPDITDVHPNNTMSKTLEYLAITINRIKNYQKNKHLQHKKHNQKPPPTTPTTTPPQPPQHPTTNTNQQTQQTPPKPKKHKN